MGVSTAASTGSIRKDTDHDQSYQVPRGGIEDAVRMATTPERVHRYNDPAASVVLANSAISGGGTDIRPAELALIAVWEAVSDVDSRVVACSRV